MSADQALMDLLINRNMDNTLGDRTDTSNKVGASLSDALSVAREQELHLKSMQQEDEKLKGQQIKNDKASLDIELTKAKAKAEGLFQDLPQDPQKAPTAKDIFSSGMFASQLPPRQPSSGEALTNALLEKDTNFSKSLVESLDSRLAQLRQSGQRKTDDKAKQQDEWLRDELITTLKRVDSEKSLSLSPFGQAGGIVGGLLDIVSGPLDLGTELFGGKVSAAQKSELLTRAISASNPLLRAEMADAFNRDKMEQSAEQFLTRRGLGNMKSYLGSSNDQDGADEIVATAIDIRRLLENNMQDSFGSEAVTGIGQAFDAYENIKVLVDQLKEARTEEEATAIGEKIMHVDTSMRALVRQYLLNGGTPETFNEKVIQAIDLVNKNYQTPLKFQGDIRATQFVARQKAVARDFTEKLADMHRAIMEDIQMDVKAVAPAIESKKKADEARQKQIIETGLREFSKGKNSRFK